MFRKPGEETDEEGDEDEGGPEASACEGPAIASAESAPQLSEAVRIATEQKITIHEDD